MAATDERGFGVRRSRVVLTPRRWRQVVAGSCFRRGDGVKKPVTGESTKQAVKPLRREGRSVSAEPVCSCASFFYQFAHETAGAARTRSSLRPLFSKRANVPANLGRTAPREGGVVLVILSRPILRDAASRLLRMRSSLPARSQSLMFGAISVPHGEERGNAARLEPCGPKRATRIPERQ